MRKGISLIVCFLILSSSEAVKNTYAENVLDTIGAFELNPVPPNNYWYDGKSYQYNEYEIEITSEPYRARIQWNGKNIGTTPLVYRFTGILEKDEYIRVRAAPIEGNLPAQEAKLRVRTELPRKIHFDLDKK
ncbi:MAG: hypothetical protein NC938_05325 [Candidatus Omnitrophica bacterium]|nr:hypothetical protein [Candidatus Omnitrophota bacterium]MCM8791102.1 hypothetical protein [Candidatus Omnitrophota bacterium]